jgi:methylmalonyl-CoA/ethylmalonyl-CoA epimerase
MTQPLLTRLDHVGLAVRDLDASVAFYERVFGLRAVHEETNEDQGVREVMLATADGTPSIQLLAPLTDDSPMARFLERSGEGVQQVAYQVEDVVAVAESLTAAGLRVLYDQPKVGTGGTMINFVHPKDAGGVLIELVEPVRR